jgi:predicted ATPase/class 3 adenylate cyclase
VGVGLPSGTVTFLFTDIEGSTRRWETDPEAMRPALVLHDEVLRSATEAHGGWLFKHTGDGVCAAFGSARAAIDAAVEAQRTLALPVRMGIATGEADRRGEDYFGPVLNRTARVMAAGHGGQILVAASTAAVVSGVELVDLGEHRLRDLSGVEHLHQVRAHGLRVDFAPLRTLDAVPGNLPVQTTSFVGREMAVKELAEQVRAHRLVTLTGVGGVGKTRLAVQVAAELIGEFSDGAWLVELAPVGDPAAVPDAAAGALGVTARAGGSRERGLAEVLVGRKLLVVLDNCEHLLARAADLVEAIAAVAPTVSVLATSRESLGVAGEQVWPVQPLETGDGFQSAAVGLFVERAQAASPAFVLGADSEAVAEVCQHLDGIPLAIELAAARMRSMSPSEVRDRLGERFRFLTGSQRGPQRHRTLRDAVQWSCDLLTDDERMMLRRCGVFAGGFDVRAAQAVGEELGEYEVLDVLDSLVRKSLVTTATTGGRTRYGMLETIREFASDQLDAAGEGDMTRDRHAHHYAYQADAHLELWASSKQPVAHQWIRTELANLRVGFRRATTHNDLDAASRIAIAAAIIGVWVQRYEPFAWAEELLDEARDNNLRRLPALYAAAAHCGLMGRPDDAIAFGEAAVAINDDPNYEPVPFAYGHLVLSAMYSFAGRRDRAEEVSAICRGRADDRLSTGLCQLTMSLGSRGRFDEAQVLAEAAVSATQASGIPSQIAFALVGYGRAFAEADPAQALHAMRRGLAVAHECGNSWHEGYIGQELASLEARHGDTEAALDSFSQVIDSRYQAGDVVLLSTTFAHLVVFLDRLQRYEAAATVYGFVDDPFTARVSATDLSIAAEHLSHVLGAAAFAERVDAGAIMDRREAALFAQTEIQQARSRGARR